ncbi:phage capsid protein [Streptomyces sp. NBC_01142]|uniref:major capsid protein n=1 Tax=Streptomyces sp. NBC_01142 TaxID=2975865 RepID=UPI002252EAEA|nr:phage capsid protein [Streptomyces sp. NBC_01142]MCX4824241.1 phage capsid protein [Streptomyces sp. NBC_01142]
MAITLADAKLNTTDDLDLMVIDEFRKSSWLLDNLTFDDVVNPAGGGATLTYGYTRLVSERGAQFRPFNTEYPTAQAKRARYTVDLSPLGGAFEVDRILGNLGPAATNETAFQMGQQIKAARTFFADQVINGVRDKTAAAEKGFDGLDVALTGTATEMNANASVDWTGATLGTDQAKAHDALDLLDEFLSLLDGTPSALFGNKKTIARVRSLARRAGYYSRTENAFGQTVESYNGIPFVDLGEKAGSTTPIIPIETRDVDGAGAGGNITGLSDLYAARLGLDGFHGVSTAGGTVVRQWLPDFTSAGAVKKGEVELGPVAVVLKATKAAAVLRNVKAQ